jgi:hypothetical protein
LLRDECNNRSNGGREDCNVENFGEDH